MGFSQKVSEYTKGAEEVSGLGVCNRQTTERGGGDRVGDCNRQTPEKGGGMTRWGDCNRQTIERGGMTGGGGGDCNRQITERGGGGNDRGATRSTDTGKDCRREARRHKMLTGKGERTQAQEADGREGKASASRTAPLPHSCRIFPSQ